MLAWLAPPHAAAPPEFVHRCSTSGTLTCPLTVRGGPITLKQSRYLCPVTFEAVAGDPQCQPQVVWVLLKSQAEAHSWGLAAASRHRSDHVTSTHPYVARIKKDRKK